MQKYEYPWKFPSLFPVDNGTEISVEILFSLKKNQVSWTQSMGGRGAILSISSSSLSVYLCLSVTVFLSAFIDKQITKCLFYYLCMYTSYSCFVYLSIVQLTNDKSYKHPSCQIKVVDQQIGIALSQICIACNSWINDSCIVSLEKSYMAMLYQS